MDVVRTRFKGLNCLRYIINYNWTDHSETVVVVIIASINNEETWGMFWLPEQLLALVNTLCLALDNTG